MTAMQNTQTTMGCTVVNFSKRRGWRGLSARAVVVASDNRNVHEWIYRYLEPYGDRGYAFFQADNEAEYFSLVQSEKPVIAFIEGCFFGESMVGRLECVRKQYPKLRLALFSVSAVSSSAIARHAYWSRESYISLRDSDKEIRELVEAVFSGRRALPSRISDCVDEYSRLPDIEPYLTNREIEVVRCVAEEKTAKKTASCLMVSEKTVTNHLTSVYRKFGVKNKVGVLNLAVSKGILPIDELMTYTVQS